MKISSDYTSNRAWLRDVVGNQPMILRSVSALEYLQLFVGYFSENKVEVYALEESSEENIRCHIIEDLEAIERFEELKDWAINYFEVG